MRGRSPKRERVTRVIGAAVCVAFVIGFLTGCATREANVAIRSDGPRPVMRASEPSRAVATVALPSPNQLLLSDAAVPEPYPLWEVARSDARLGLVNDRGVSVEWFERDINDRQLVIGGRTFSVYRQTLRGYEGRGR
jgi:hypothetical protein